MLNPNAAYTAQSSAKNVVGDWLLELSYDGGTFYFSGADRTVTNFYRGNVTEWGVIDESIDIDNSTSSISDVEIILANSYPNESGLLSAELFGGSKHFINRAAIIKSWLPGLALTECLTLYSGRIADIKHNGETVSIILEKIAPYEDIEIFDPMSSSDAADGINLPSNSKGKSKPFVYGDYRSHVGDTAASTAEITREMQPSRCVYLGIDTSGRQRWLIANHEVEAVDEIWGYDNDLGRFVHLLNGDYTVEQNTSDGCIISFGVLVMFQDYWYSDGTTSGEVTGGAATVTDEDKMGDSGVDTKGVMTAPDSAAVSTAEILIGFANYDYTDVNINDIQIVVRCAWDADGSGATFEMGTAADGLVDVTGTADVNNFIDVDPGWLDVLADIAKDVKIKVVCSDGPFGTAVPTADIYEVYKRIEYSPKRMIDIYFGGRGLEKCTWTGGTTLDCNLPHRIHRDLLNTYAGFNAANINAVQVNGYDWSSARGDRIDVVRNWPCRYSNDKSVSLKGLLEQIQFEANFIWVFDAASSGIEARVIHPTASYSNADKDLDGDNLAELTVGHIPISSVISTRKMNYKPLTNTTGYAEQNSKVNADRSDWNFGAKENIVIANADLITESSDIDSTLGFYDATIGTPLVLLTSRLLSRGYWVLQTGDVITFSNMPLDPFGGSWSGVYFRVINTKISPDKFIATFREVG